jgi:hypothetical protein
MAVEFLSGADRGGVWAIGELLPTVIDNLLANVVIDDESQQGAPAAASGYLAAPLAYAPLAELVPA